MTGASSQTDALLIDRIRAGQSDAWGTLIERFEGRLLAFVDSRLRDRAASEDVVQETFVGFLTSLPNYDAARSLETWLFSIAAHKLTDALRRQGRRPTLPLLAASSEGSAAEPPGSDRPVSSLARSQERRGVEETALVAALGRMLTQWRADGAWEKLKTAELLFVRGWPNKRVAQALGLSEQTVANHKFAMLARLRNDLRARGLTDDALVE